MRATVHASCIVLADAGRPFGAPPDAGVLLLGPSGAGKSDLALRLVMHGAVLVADDRTELFLDRGQLMARPPQALASLLEIRGVGIVEIGHARMARVALACALAAGPIARLPEPEWFDPAPIELARAARPPLLRIDPLEASAPAKVAAAAAAHAHRRFRHFPIDT